MLKYTEVRVVFREVPGEVTLAFNISNCPVRCKDCHSKQLWENIGKELTTDIIDTTIRNNEGITCVSLMGGDSNPEEALSLLKYVHNTHGLRTCWYSGRKFNPELDYEGVDYVKTGPYVKEYGGLDNPGTNQRFYSIGKNTCENGKTCFLVTDITEKFNKNYVQTNN